MVPDEIATSLVIAEYNSLRAEILQEYRLVLEIVGLVLSSTVLIMAYGISTRNPYAFLVPYPLLIMGCYYLASKRRTIYTIASYIRCRIEKRHPPLGWETALTRARESPDLKPLIEKKGNTFGCEMLVMNSLGIVLMVLYCGFLHKGCSGWLYCIPILLVVVLLAVSIVQYGQVCGMRNGSSMDALWEPTKGESTKNKEGAGPSAAPADWSGKLARHGAVYFCLCGLVVLALDLLAARARGEFAMNSSASYAVMRYMMPVGVVASLVAYIGYPSQLKWRIAAVVEVAIFGLGTFFSWALVYLGVQ